MENFDEFIKQRLLSLPIEIQKAFNETDIVGEIEKIRVKFKLMYDQGSALESETKLVFLGLEKPDDLLKNIVENVNISKDIATQIVGEVEKNIFKQIKKKLIETLEQEEEESKKKENKETLDKDSILWEIENPKPTVQPIQPTIKTEEKAKETPKIQSNIPEIAPTQVLQKYTAPTGAKNLVEKKLSEPTHITPKEAEISLKKIPQILNNSVSQTQKPTVDPYKEAI
jgi:hypothetical protein